MRIGIDARHAPWPKGLCPAEQVIEAKRHGLEGLFFRSILDISPTLDQNELAELRAAIDEHDMYLEAGLSVVNPYALAESPKIRALGGGDTLLGFQKMITAAASIGITDLWAATGGYKPYNGRLAFDRYRTDAPWLDQLAAIERFLLKLAPIAREHGVHINLETHEEITSFELVRLIDRVGFDVVGVNYDTANPLQRAEHPAMTVSRISRFVRQTHIKDCGLFFDPPGVKTQARPVGQGVVDMPSLLRELANTNPDLNLSLEAVEPIEDSAATFSQRVHIVLNDPEWIHGHPDLSVTEFARYLSLVQEFSDRVARGDAKPYQAYAGHPHSEGEAWDWVAQSVNYLRPLCRELSSQDGRILDDRA